MSEKLSGRYCNCHAPDPKAGYCQNCGEKAWPESTQYEDLRHKFDAEMRDRVDHPLKYMTARDPVDQIRELIDIGAPDVLTRIAEVLGIRELESASQPGGRCVKCGGARVDPSPLMTGACECQAECQRCGGSGWVVRDPDIGTDQECPVCDGTGHIKEESQPGGGEATFDSWLADNIPSFQMDHYTASDVAKNAIELAKAAWDFRSNP